MSYNLQLVYSDSDGTCVKNVELFQTPSRVTERILALKTHNHQLHAYLDWVEQTFDESESDLKQRRTQAINEGMKLFGFTYKQATRSLALMPDLFLSSSLREYKRLYEIDLEYGEKYESKFIGV